MSKVKEILTLWSREQDYDIKDYDLPVAVGEEIKKQLDIADENYGGLDVRPTGNEDGAKLIVIDLGDDPKNNYNEYLEEHNLDLHCREFHDTILKEDECIWYSDLFIMTEYAYIFIYKLSNKDK